MKRLALCLILLEFSLSCFSQTVPWLSKETIIGAHDPTIIKDERGVYTLLSTNNMLELRQSDDLLTWKTVGNVISKVPSYMNNVDNIWAPQITFLNGRYWVYYCGSTFGTNNSWIGVASSPTLNTAAANYKWTDHGEVMKSTTSDNYNCIDPEIITDANGKVWMSFGSFWSGIKMVAIDPVTGKRLPSDNTLHAIASRGGGALEGPATFRYNGYYYLVTAWDKCCAGTSSTYRTMVGRSQSVTGPYLDKAGKSLASSGGTQVMGSYGRYVGPGGGSPFKDGRKMYFAHHYYNASQNGAPSLQIREIVVDNANWPVFTQPFLGRRQSFEAEHAQLINVDILSSDAASNKEYVGGLDATDSRVVFHVNALQGGDFVLRISFSSPLQASSHFLKINNATETEITYTASSTVIEFPESRTKLVAVSLTEGYNLLTFRKGTGIAHLDRIDLIRNARSIIEAGSFDDSKVVDYIANGNNAIFSSGDWAKFENVDFGSGKNDQAIVSFSGSCNGQLKLSVDHLNGPVYATANLAIKNAVSGYNVMLPSSFSEASGVRDLYITYTGTEGCAIDDFRFSKSIISGLASESFLHSVSVYPNPFQDHFELLSSGEVSYEITDFLGRSIRNGVSAGLTVIDNISAKGTYFIRITKGDHSTVKKIIRN